MGLYGYGSKLDTPISWLLTLKMNWLKSIVPKSLILTRTHIWCLVLSWIIRFYLVISWTFGRYSLTPMQYGDFLWHGGTANHRSHGWSWLSIETHGDLGIYFKNPLGCMPCDVLSDMPTKMGYIPTQQCGIWYDLVTNRLGIYRYTEEYWWLFTKKNMDWRNKRGVYPGVLQSGQHRVKFWRPGIMRMWGWS